MNNPANRVPTTGRRDFLKGLFAGIIGTAIGLFPLGAGLAVLLDPLRRKTKVTGATLVTTLEALPADGVPRKFPVLATRVDAWNKFSQVPVGAVYLRRTAEGQVQAFNVVCPHLGCFVDYLPNKGQYECPCHNSVFSVAGTIANPASPAPRGLDALEVEVRQEKEIWVRFQNFQTGHAKKIPVA